MCTDVLSTTCSRENCRTGTTARIESVDFRHWSPKPIVFLGDTLVVIANARGARLRSCVPVNQRFAAGTT